MRKSRLASPPTRLEPWRAIVEELSANWKLAAETAFAEMRVQSAAIESALPHPDFAGEFSRFRVS